MSQTANRIAKNTGFLYARMGITVFISLWTTRLILNALGAVDFGIFGIVGGAIAMLGFLNSTMANTTQRFLSYSQGKNDIVIQKRIFNNSVLLHLLIAFVVVLLIEAASFPLFKSILVIPEGREDAAFYIYQFLILSTFITVISVPYDAAINAHEEFGYYAVIGVAESLLKLGIAFLVVYTSLDKLVVYGLLTVLLTVFTLTVKASFCRKYSECHLCIKKYYHLQTIKKLMGFAWWRLLETGGSLIGNHGGDIIMNHYFGPSVNAAGNIGTQLRGQIMALSNNMLKAISPSIVKSEGCGDRAKMIALTMSGSKITYILYAFLALPFIVEAPYILKLWLKNVPEWTVAFSRIQMIIGLGYQMNMTVTIALGATGMIKNNSIFSGLMNLLPLIIYVLLFVNGAAPIYLYIISFVNIVLVIEGYKLYQSKLHFGFDVKKYLKIIVAPNLACSAMAVVFGFFITTIIPESLCRLCLSVFLVDTLYIYVSYYFVLNGQERDYVREVIAGQLKKIKNNRI